MWRKKKKEYEAKEFEEKIYRQETPPSSTIGVDIVMQGEISADENLVITENLKEELIFTITMLLLEKVEK